jgi:hypothetical protein
MLLVTEVVNRMTTNTQIYDIIRWEIKKYSIDNQCVSVIQFVLSLGQSILPLNLFPFKQIV